MFCDNRSFSPSRRVPRGAIRAQLDEGIRRLKWRYDVNHFLAYFQPATNTYAPVDRLRASTKRLSTIRRSLAWPSARVPIAFRKKSSSCLARSPARTYLSVEFGLQTIHDRSLDWMNRGHHHDAFLDAVERSRGRGFEFVRHVMLGLAR